MKHLSREENRRAWRWAALIVLMLFALAALVLMLKPAPFTGGSSPDLSKAAQGLDEISIDAAFDPQAGKLSAVQRLRMTNRTGTDQENIVLRSWSGAYLQEETSPAAAEELFLSCYGDMFRSGGLTLLQARVNGTDVTWQYSDKACTVLMLPCDWAGGSTAEVWLHYEVAVPECASRFGQRSDIFALGNVFPLPAVWADGAWRTDPYIAVGDPFVSECANWTVSLTLPEGYTLASTGTGTAAASGGQTCYTLYAPATRDFALTISSAYHTAMRQTGGTKIIACALAEKNAQAMLSHAEAALRSYEARWGEYQYPTLTLAEVDFPFGGMEYPQLVMISSDTLRAGGQTLAWTVAHETAHQWWAVQVGSDGWYQAWQDETLCEYAALVCMGEQYGAAVREEMVFSRIETALRVTLPTTATPGSPLDYFADLSDYGQVVYQRGAALWLALEKLMGQDALDTALGDYQAQYCFRIATRQALEDVLSRHAGMDIAPLLLDYLDTLMQ